ncbi:MAG: hypothetical protein HC826_01395 [Rhodospirillales bacterium]|nr:hypothetical protein [Rhodospirillales bacterium]
MSGTTETPQLVGTLAVRRGVFTFASKRFNLQRGAITFTGGLPIDPALDVAAELRTTQLTAVISVTGTVSDPELSITSQPPLPESEVMAQVLFGKGSAQLGPVEAVQLASALDTLIRGESWSDDVLGSFRQFLGLDVFTIGTSDASDGEGGGPTVEAGRYLADGLYVGAIQDLEDGETGGRVEVEILPGFSLQSDLSQNAEGVAGSLGVRWKHDY